MVRTGSLEGRVGRLPSAPRVSQPTNASQITHDTLSKSTKMYSEWL